MITLRQLLETMDDHAAYLDDKMIVKIHGDICNIANVQIDENIDEDGKRHIILQTEDE